MNNIKYTFSISDLENFTGIKTHTIRVWERRYGLLTPERTEGNQRFYGLEELQKLLNVKMLYERGMKISKIAAIPVEQIPRHVLDIISDVDDQHQAIDMMKVAMLNFDQALFEKTYLHLISNLSFRRVFLDVFIPLLEHIGYLWQADSITPAHEHFISNLIQQKVMSQVERIQTVIPHKMERTFVLYLPEKEIHDLGLLYLNYELILRGWKSIYLGQSVPIGNLRDLMAIYPNITFISYFTVQPTASAVGDYIERLKSDILTREEDSFWILGRRVKDVDLNQLNHQIQAFPGLGGALEFLDKPLTTNE